MKTPFIQTQYGSIYQNWKLENFPECIFFQEGPGLRNWQFTDSGMKVINVKNILLNGTIDTSNSYRFISLEEFRNKYSHFAIKSGDIVVSSSGWSYGKVGRIKPTDLPLMMNTSVIRFTPLNEENLDSGYLYNFLRSPFFRNQIETFIIGCQQPNFGPAHIKRMVIPIPPITTQRKIAAILSAYDDLIENNTRRIEILEEMARSIYREWFVNFRFPGHEQVQMVDSELGLIPEGWEVGKLGDVSCVIPGYAFKSKDWQKTGIPVIKIKNINADNTVDIQKTDFVSQSILTPKIKKYLLKGGEFLIAMTGATAGKVGKLRTKEPMLLNQRVAKIEPLPNYRSYIWQIISSEEGQNRFFKLADGAAQPNMSGLQIEEVRIILPSLSLCIDFDSIVNDIYRQIDNFIFRNQTLLQTRDLLLPRLISGEIDVENLDINISQIAA